MKEIANIALKGYKVFPRNEYTRMNNISRVNVIIGKNNSGKTSLLDIIELAYDSNSPIRVGKDVDEVIFDAYLDDVAAERVMSGYSSIGGWNLTRVQEYFHERTFVMKLVGNNSINFANSNEISELGTHINRASNYLSEKRGKYRFRKVAAERNISPEMENSVVLESDGQGATNLVRVFINDGNYDETIIEKDLLGALNSIMMPEAEFDSIRVQEVTYSGQKYWEVFLQEKGMQRVPLSKTGSGLKTVVLVLLNLLVIPHVEEYKKVELIYGFEELENNLHPALQRRLFEYLYRFAIEKDVIFFITTHSHIAINSFFGKEDASIYHVIKENNVAKIKSIETHIDKTEILNDLDVKASDILQSNGIVWVEGPSDRIYIKRWLEIFTDNQFKEGVHYQFLYYGGKLLSQYALQEETELISILTTNRNAAIVMDSDKKNQQESISSTKKRIVEEFDTLNMFSWVTKGKEIENYITAKSISARFEKNVKQCGRYSLFPDYINRHYKGFAGKKVQFANEMLPYITVENTRGHLDVEEKIKKLYAQISKWNNV